MNPIVSNEIKSLLRNFIVLLYSMDGWTHIPHFYHFAIHSTPLSPSEDSSHPAIAPFYAFKRRNDVRGNLRVLYVWHQRPTNITCVSHKSQSTYLPSSLPPLQITWQEYCLRIVVNILSFAYEEQPIHRREYNCRYSDWAAKCYWHLWMYGWMVAITYGNAGLLKG